MVQNYNYVRAIIDRDGGMPYAKVLERQGLTPNMFFRAVCRIRSLSSGSNHERKTLDQIAVDPQRQMELFNMGEQYIVEQCKAVSAGKQDRLCDGLFKHPDNFKHLIYHKLTKRRPNLKKERANVIASIKRMPSNLGDYLYDVIGASAYSYLPGDSSQSPFAILQIFDLAYQDKTGDKSLFDLSAKTHIHPWRYIVRAPRNYWSEYENVKTATYHMLSGADSRLASHDRTTVLQGIRDLPSNLQEYLGDIDLWGVMMSQYVKGSILKLFQIFSEGFKEKTGNPSLFDRRFTDSLGVNGTKLVR